MIFLLVLPAIVSSVVLGAHFLRAQILPLVAVCALFPLILLFKRRWAAKAMQLFLCFGAGVWGWTALELAQQREATGDPWTRMALILGGVSLLALLSALLFQTRRLRNHYAKDSNR